MTKRVIIEIEDEALAAAREAGLDLSELLNRAVRRHLPLSDDERELAAKKWYEDNKQAVDWYNRFVAEHGLFSDSFRKF